MNAERPFSATGRAFSCALTLIALSACVREQPPPPLAVAEIDAQTDAQRARLADVVRVHASEEAMQFVDVSREYQRLQDERKGPKPAVIYIGVYRNDERDPASLEVLVTNAQGASAPTVIFLQGSECRRAEASAMKLLAELRQAFPSMTLKGPPTQTLSTCHSG